LSVGSRDILMGGDHRRSPINAVLTDAIQIAGGLIDC